MRTTIRIDEALYRQAKAKAAETGRTVSEVIADAVRQALRADPAAVPVEPLPTFEGTGVLPGVDLGSNAALRAVMDEDTDLDALR